MATRATMPEGFVYRPEFITAQDEQNLLAQITPMKFSEVRMHGVVPEKFGEVLVTEYPAGAGIGWHRDAPALEIRRGGLPR